MALHRRAWQMMPKTRYWAAGSAAVTALRLRASWGLLGRNMATPARPTTSRRLLGRIQARTDGGGTIDLESYGYLPAEDACIVTPASPGFPRTSCSAESVPLTVTASRRRLSANQPSSKYYCGRSARSPQHTSRNRPEHGGNAVYRARLFKPGFRASSSLSDTGIMPPGGRAPEGRSDAAPVDQRHNTPFSGGMLLPGGLLGPEEGSAAGVTPG